MGCYQQRVGSLVCRQQSKEVLPVILGTDAGTSSLAWVYQGIRQAVMNVPQAGLALQYILYDRHFK